MIKPLFLSPGSPMLPVQYIAYSRLLQEMGASLQLDAMLYLQLT